MYNNPIIEQFKERFIQNAIMIESPDESVSILQNGTDLFFLAESGGFSEKRKEELEQMFNKDSSNSKFISIFENRNELEKLTESIAWDSFVWIRSEPEHIIHFDSSPEIKPYS